MALDIKLKSAQTGRTFQDLESNLQQVSSAQQTVVPPKKEGDTGGIKNISGLKRKQEDIFLETLQKQSPLFGGLLKKGTQKGRELVAFGKGAVSGVTAPGAAFEEFVRPVTAPITSRIAGAITGEEAGQVRAEFETGEAQRRTAQQEALALPEDATAGEKFARFAGEQAPAFALGTRGAQLAGAGTKGLLGKFGEKVTGRALTAGAEGVAFEAIRQAATGEALSRPFEENIKQIALSGAISGAFPVVGAMARGISNKTKNLSRFLGSKVSGLENETIETIIKNPQKYKELQKAGVKAEDLFSGAKNRLKGILQQSRSLTESLRGQRQALKQSGDTIKFGNTLKNAIKKAGFEITKKGDDIAIRSTKKAKTSLNKENVQEIKNLIRDFDEKTLNIDDYLNFRSRIDELSKFDRIGETPLTKMIRAEMNKVARQQNTKLAEIDDAFSDQFKNVFKVLEDTGVVKRDKGTGALEVVDDYVNKIRKASREEGKKLEKLERFLPGIKNDVEVAKAMSDVERAMSNKTGQYMQAGLAVMGTGAATQDPTTAGMVGLGFLLLNPKSFASTVANNQIFKQGVKNSLTSISKKILSGAPLTGKEAKVFNDAMKQIDLPTGESLRKARDAARSITASEMSGTFIPEENE